MMLTLVDMPQLSFLLVVAALLAAAGAALWRVLRQPRQAGGRWTLMFLRWVTLLSLGAILLLPPQPAKTPQDAAAKPLLAIVLDGSASMATADVPLQDKLLSRFDFARQRWLDPAVLTRWSATHRVEFYLVSDQTRRAEVSDLREPTGRVSPLAFQLSTLLTSLPAAGSGGAEVLLLSDGRDTQQAPAAPVAHAAARQNIRLHTVTLGDTTLQRDLAVSLHPAQAFLLPGETGQLLVDITAQSLAGQATTLDLAGPAGVETFPLVIPPPPLGRISLKLPIMHTEAGLFDYTLRVSPVNGESNLINNEAFALVEVSDARLRVLLLEGQPYWDTRNLAQVLQQDERFDVTALFKLRADRLQVIASRPTAAATLPTSAQDLADYDVVVLGRGLSPWLSPTLQAALFDYVSRQGGHLVFARGQPLNVAMATDAATLPNWSSLWPLRSSGPADSGSQPTARGRLQWSDTAPMQAIGQVFAEGLPGFDLMQPGPPLRLFDVDALLKPATQVLATVDQQPALVHMPLGQGSVLAVLGEGLGRWDLLAAQRGEESSPLAAFWTAALRWLDRGEALTPGRAASLRSNRHQLSPGETVTLRLTLRDASDQAEPPQAVITRPDGSESRIGLRQADRRGQHWIFDDQPAMSGMHHVRLLDPPSPDPALETRFLVQANDAESTLTAADAGWMATLAQESFGQILDPQQPAHFTAMLQRQATALDALTESTQRAEPSAAWFLWLLGWLTLEWWLWRRWT